MIWMPTKVMAWSEISCQRTVASRCVLSLSPSSRDQIVSERELNSITRVNDGQHEDPQLTANF